MLGYEGRHRVIVSEGSLTIAAKPMFSHYSLGSLRVYSRGLVESKGTTLSYFYSRVHHLASSPTIS